MRNFRIYLLCGIAAAFVLAGCEKQPTASFSTDKTTYYSGETVYLSNTSTNADHYEWTLPNGEYLTSTNVDYTVYTTYSDTRTFYLTAYSKSGKKTDSESHTVYVEPSTGDVTFWTSSSGTGTITVSFASSYGYITYYYYYTPDCGSSGCANFYDLSWGQTYYYYATAGSYYWDGYITIGYACCQAARSSFASAGSLAAGTGL
jgi:hypothetical protein